MGAHFLDPHTRAVLGPTQTHSTGGKTTINELQPPLCSRQRLRRLRSAKREKYTEEGFRLGRRSPIQYALIRLPRQQRPNWRSSVLHAGLVGKRPAVGHKAVGWT